MKQKGYKNHNRSALATLLRACESEEPRLQSDKNHKKPAAAVSPSRAYSSIASAKINLPCTLGALGSHL